MIEFLLRCFAKNGDVDSPSTRLSIGKAAGITGLICNTLLFAAKLVTGLLSGSVSIIADAVNNLSDTASSIITMLGFRMAQQPADKDHPFGHARYEYLSGLIISALIFSIGLDLVKSSAEKIIHPTSVNFSAVVFTILTLSIAVKFWMYLFFSKLGKRMDSTPLKAAAFDSINDVFTTSAVLAGCLTGYFFNVKIDGYIGFAVALFILYSGFKLMKEAISPLLGRQADKEFSDKLSRLILSHDKILGIHDLLVHDYGPGQYYASVHAELSAYENPLVCHDIIDDIECEALTKLNVSLVIHYDPVVCDDAEWNEMQETVREIISGINPRLNIHDFRLVRGAKNNKLVFDLAVPYSMTNQRVKLKETIDNELVKMGKNYITVIRFDAKG